MRLRDLLEALLGLLVARVAVRVVLARQLAVGLLDLLVGGVLADPEDLVVVGPLSHGVASPSRRRPRAPGAGRSRRGGSRAGRPRPRCRARALDRLLGDGLVQGRVELLALGRVGLDPGALQRGEQVGVDVLDPGHERAARLVRRRSGACSARGRGCRSRAAAPWRAWSPRAPAPPRPRAPRACGSSRSRPASAGRAPGTRRPCPPSVLQRVDVDGLAGVGSASAARRARPPELRLADDRLASGRAPWPSALGGGLGSRGLRSGAPRGRVGPRGM